MIEYLIAAIISLLLTIMLVIITWSIIQKLIQRLLVLVLNSVGALSLLLALHYLMDVDIPINYATLIITTLFGFPGVGTLIFLHFFGMI
ncbi:MAG: pro-sigmaK processing inhibitor BofA family protein [Candidatus Altiarchaeota archaeon]